MTEIPRDRCAADDCERQTIARKLCTKHYQRWKRRNPRDVASLDYGVPAIDRLLGRCVERDGCWVYQGSLNNGYARLRGVDGRAKVFGHRLAWEHFVGPIPEGLTFDHLCRNRACVNPWHGELVTGQVNSDRSPAYLARINREKVACPQGHLFSGDNLGFTSSGYGRVCRTCRAESSRAYRARRAGKVAS